MSTALNQGAPKIQLPKVENLRVAIVKAQWNSHITNALTDGAMEVFKSAGLDTTKDIDVFEVPGTVELTFGASQCIEAGLWDAVIVFGCVIRGDTPHFDYVCQSVTQGITALNADCDIPVIFGVLTVENEQQALDRAGGRLCNKGSECAQAAIAMVNFKRKVADM